MQESSSSGIKVQRSRARKSEALWMTTFSDLSFILMCFFALLLSMSTINTRKFDEVQEGIKAEKTPKSLPELQVITSELEEAIKSQELEQEVKVIPDTNGVAIEFKDRVLFPSGSAAIPPKFIKLTDAVLKVLAKIPPKYRLTIEGHTDDTKLVPGADFKSNWDLSSARGISMLHLLERKGIGSERMRVVAYADKKPLVLTEGRRGNALREARAANRRVVIRIE